MNIKNDTKTAFDWAGIKGRLEQAARFFDQPADAVRTGELYRRRAQQLAQRQAQLGRQTTDVPLLLFTLQNNKYGLELSRLAEILPFKKCTPVPQAHRTIKGIINVRGEIHCVLDLAGLIELEPQPTPDSSQKTAAGTTRDDGYVLIVKKNQVGLKIDAIDRILFIKRTEAEQMDKEKNNVPVKYSKGIITGTIILLDVDKIMSHPVFASTMQAPE